MASRNEQQVKRCRAHARKTCIQHAGRLIGLTVWQLLLRVVGLAPLYFLFGERKDPIFSQQTDFYCIGFMCAWYILVVMPARYFAAGQRTAWAIGEKRERFKYTNALGTGLLRLLLGLPWAAAFLFTASAFVYMFNYSDFTTFFKLLGTLGGIVGGRMDAGVLLWLGTIVLAAIVFIYGWWRGVPLDYQPVSRRSPGQAYQHSHHVRKTNRRSIIENGMKNALCYLPSLLLMAAVMLYYMLGEISFSNGAYAVVGKINTLLHQELPLWVWGAWGGILVLAHLPLMNYRKMCNAVLLCDIDAA